MADLEIEEEYTSKFSRMEFKLISPNKGIWNDFVDNNRHSCIFQRYEIADIYNKTRNMKGLRFAVSNEEEKLLACMTIKIESKKFLKPLTSVSIIENAPLYEDSEQGKKAAEFLVDYYDKYIKKKVLYTNVKIDKNSFLERLYESEWYNKTECLNFEIKLDKDLDIVFRAIHKSRRKNIKKAAKNGLVVIESDMSSLPDFYKLLQETYDKVGIPVPDISFFNVTFDLIPNNVKLFLGKYGDKFIAGRIVLLYKKKIFDWYAGASSEYLNLFPNDTLVWHILGYGCKNGYELFDFGGAGIPDEEYGVREFKRRFGGQMVRYNSFKKVQRPIITKLGGMFFYFYRKIF